MGWLVPLIAGAATGVLSGFGIGGGTLLLYDAADAPAHVRAAAARLVAEGARVTALTEAPPGARFARVVRLEREEEVPC